MPLDEMLSWLPFCTSVCRTERAPSIDIIDPAGIIRSQAIANVAGSQRLTLNGAENTRTFAGHFIAESFGSAVQHLPFATRHLPDRGHLRRQRLRDHAARHWGR